MKYVSIDLETTGLDPESCQILEFGAVIEDTNNIVPVEELPSFHAYIIPKNGNLFGNVYALDLNKDIINKLKRQKELEGEFNFIEIENLAHDFMFWLYENGYILKDKEGQDERVLETITVAGKNFNSFDRKFLDKVPGFNKTIRIRHRVIDPATSFVDWKNDEELPSLGECKKRIGLPDVVAHTAVEDSIDVIKLLRTQYT